MKQTIASKSEKEGYPSSRLPELDEYWISYIRGKLDTRLESIHYFI